MKALIAAVPTAFLLAACVNTTGSTTPPGVQESGCLVGQQEIGGRCLPINREPPNK
ncbi:hypothetical protein [Microvirga roseola]|uniref:hypothetical protein n=1 Tax=Microvirga roseola TaxID=2883126 RepID=UPI001E5A2D12|nr:hypothetical protein [Microvirga roseola]